MESDLRQPWFLLQMNESARSVASKHEKTNSKQQLARGSMESAKHHQVRPLQHPQQWLGEATWRAHWETSGQRGKFSLETELLASRSHCGHFYSMGQTVVASVGNGSPSLRSQEHIVLMPLAPGCSPLSLSLREAVSLTQGKEFWRTVERNVSGSETRKSFLFLDSSTFRKFKQHMIILNNKTGLL